MKLFRKTIPTNDYQEVTEVESYTLKWEIQGDGYSLRKTFHKVFVSEKDAIEYEKQLQAAAEFLGAWVSTKVYKN